MRKAQGTFARVEVAGSVFLRPPPPRCYACAMSGPRMKSVVPVSEVKVQNLFSLLDTKRKVKKASPSRRLRFARSLTRRPRRRRSPPPAPRSPPSQWSWTRSCGLRRRSRCRPGRTATTTRKVLTTRWAAVRLPAFSGTRTLLPLSPELGDCCGEPVSAERALPWSLPIGAAKQPPPPRLHRLPA